jgi:hypothetical protein
MAKHRQDAEESGEEPTENESELAELGAIRR